MPTGQYRVISPDEWQRQMESLSSDVEFSSLVQGILQAPSLNGLGSVIEESDYVDADYSSAFTHFYGRMFQPPNKFCTRYLLFERPLKGLSDLRRPAVRRSFMGFVTSWPTTPAVIGRSALRFPPGEAVQQIQVGASYKVHVDGNELELRSAMFASKDHAVSACATVATWLATDLLHRRFDLPTCTSSELTQLATAGDPRWGRPMPQTYGLDPGQISRALSSLGYAPYIYYFSDAYGGPVNLTNTWRAILYGYLSSSLPVIVLCSIEGVGSHALLAVGLEMGGATKADPDHGRKSFSRAVSSVLVHDDRYGPFVRLKPTPASAVGIPKATIQYHDGKTRNVTINALIVPLPEGVTLVSEDAHNLGVPHLNEVTRRMLEEAEYQGPFRTRLLRSTEFKAEAESWRSVYPLAARRLKSMSLPRWVWVTEAYLPTAPVAEVHAALARGLYDPTQLKFGQDALFLAGHVGNAVLDDRKL